MLATALAGHLGSKALTSQPTALTVMQSWGLRSAAPPTRQFFSIRAQHLESLTQPEALQKHQLDPQGRVHSPS